MMKSAIFLLATVLGLQFARVDLYAQNAPRLLPFQGRLTDQNGVAVSNGVRLVQFKIFEVPSGGSPAWAGELHRTTVNGGLVNVLLGSKTPFTGVDFNRQLYLEITVDINSDNAITTADPPMLPRQSILPAVFAKEAANSRLLDGHNWSALFAEGAADPSSARLSGTRIVSRSISAEQIANNTITSDRIADGAVQSQDIVPTERIGAGTIMMHHTFGGITPVPRGWMKCDGTIINQINYDNLHGAGAFEQDRIAASVILGRNLPDFINRYAVGVGNTPNSGSNAIPSVGSAGNSVNLAHTHQVPTHNHQWISQDNIHGTAYSLMSFNSAGQTIQLGFGAPSLGNRIGVQNSSSGIAGDYYTGVNSGPFTTGVSSIESTSIQPDSIQVIFIIKVK